MYWVPLRTVWSESRLLAQACLYIIKVKEKTILGQHNSVPYVFQKFEQSPFNNLLMCLKCNGWVANSVDSDQTPRFAASGQSLRCFLGPVCLKTQGYYGNQFEYKLLNDTLVEHDISIYLRDFLKVTLETNMQGSSFFHHWSIKFQYC